MRDLKQYFSDANPTGAYGKIQGYLMSRNFSHEQYSGYHSRYKTTYLEIFDLVCEMGKEFTWLQKCLNHFEVTNVGINYDLMKLFDRTFSEIERINILP